VPHRHFARALARLLVTALLGGAVAAQTAAPAVTVESTSPAAVLRLAETAARALTELVEWLGPLPVQSITVVDLPWAASTPGKASPGTVATRFRWITPVRDLSAERSLIAELARQFWIAPVTDATAPFHEALVIYTATRAIHRVLEGRHFAAPRYVGGFVSMPVRSLMLSHNPAGRGAPLGEFDEVLHPGDAAWRFASAADGSPARRASVALRTLERMIGWPAMQQALAAVRERAAGSPISPEFFAAVVAEQRGVPLQWFVRDLVRSRDRIDYAVDTVTSSGSNGAIRTAIGIERLGAGVFSGTDRPRDDEPARTIPVMVRFADGSETRAFIDGRDQRSDILIESGSPAATVAVDPDEMVLVDANRMNNGWVADAPSDPVGRRLIASWMVWLQHVILTCTALA